MDDVEAMARAITVAEGVDPDARSVGFGRIMPKGKEYALWECRVRVAEAALAHRMTVVTDEMVERAAHGEVPGPAEAGAVSVSKSPDRYHHCCELCGNQELSDQGGWLLGWSSVSMSWLAGVDHISHHVCDKCYVSVESHIESLKP